MTRSIFIQLVCMMVAATAFGAATYYYQKPDASSLPDNARVLMYDPASGGADKNITGLKLKQEIAAFANLSSSRAVGTQSGILNYIAQPATGAKLVKQAAAGDSSYARQVEVKDTTGKIVMWINTTGTMVFGTPVALSISAVYPANGATGVTAYTTSIDPDTGETIYSYTLPTVTFNKATAASLSTLYLVGDTTAPLNIDGGAGTWGIPAALAPNTTYTIKVIKNSITQTDGQTDSTCGVMTAKPDNSCESTFTTGP